MNEFCDFDSSIRRVGGPSPGKMPNALPPLTLVELFELLMPVWPGNAFNADEEQRAELLPMTMPPPPTPLLLLREFRAILRSNATTATGGSCGSYNVTQTIEPPPPPPHPGIMWPSTVFKW
ncbi:hypothetical protein GQX74_007421 [Glossina fuscipes]|nr:hypothetical protein GQX74_007421 [Glossina fuscipes]